MADVAGILSKLGDFICVKIDAHSNNHVDTRIHSNRVRPNVIEMDPNRARITSISRHQSGTHSGADPVDFLRLDAAFKTD